MRQKPRHPGAQTSLVPLTVPRLRYQLGPPQGVRSPSLEHRYWDFYALRQSDPVELDRFMWAYAHVDDQIGRLKDAGLERFPSSDFDANSAWLARADFAADLARWFQLLCLRDDLRQAESKARRWRLWHAPARMVRSGQRTILWVLDSWPDAKALLGVHRRMALLT